MKRFKRIILPIALFTLLSCLAVFVTVSTISTAIARVIVVPTTTFFPITINGHVYKCYSLEDEHGDPTPGVAIAWGETSATVPNEIVIPSSVTHEGNPYTIRAVAKAGFRYCGFKSITLPQTIEMIGEEAFAYCQKLETFKIPHLVDEIKPSTFLDCRALESVKYSDALDNDVYVGNETITSIGDHAFDSCISLRTFYVPKNVTYFGSSCFQKCSKMVNFFFPSRILLNSAIQNYITVRPYAFADCSSLSMVYFEENMKEIDDHAFAQCNTDMVIKYTGNSEPTFKRDGVTQSYWRNKNIDHSTDSSYKYSFATKHSRIVPDEDYPCFRYAIENKAVKLDSSGKYSSKCTVYAIPSSEATSQYACIYKFDVPGETIYSKVDPSIKIYDKDTGELTLPNTLGGKTLKVIKESAFAQVPEITRVKFNTDLVQICRKAFFNCVNIGKNGDTDAAPALDFSACTKLVEVSMTCFQDYTIENKYVTRIILPNCLQYLGDHSFANFVKVNKLVLPNNLQAMADLCFFRLGRSITDDPAIDLILPKSLNDAAAKNAYFEHQNIHTEDNKSFQHKDYTRWYAIGKYAFVYCNSIRSITMEEDTSHVGDSTYTTSVYSNAFKTMPNLLRFQSNANLKYLGKDAFKECPKLREVFLDSTKAESATEDYPWCIDEDTGKYGGTLFQGISPELVLYVSGSKAPKNLENYSITSETGSVQMDVAWNAETEGKEGNTKVYSYSNNLAPDSLYQRSHVPTYYNVASGNDVVYWDPSTKNTVSVPKTPEEYDSGIVSFVKNTSDEYTAARYFYSAGTSDDGGTGTKIIDLTSVPGVSTSDIHKLKVIGSEAFAKSENLTGNNPNDSRAPGLYFILPNTITEISERAFFRKTGDNGDGNGRFGVRVVTYKDNDGNIYLADGTSTTTNIQDIVDYVEKNGTATVSDSDRRGYCVLPNTVTTIGKLAFYNNIFKNIYLSSALKFIGHAAFYAHQSSNSYLKTASQVISISGNSNFQTINNGLYYIGNTNKKTLLYQVQDLTGGDSLTLSIASGTKAIGFQACANTRYKIFDLPTGLLTIYGEGMAKNITLEEVKGDGIGTLRYINSMESFMGKSPTIPWDDPDYDEIFDDTVAEYFDNTDYRDSAYQYRPQIQALYGAFYGCSNLKTLNFKNMTNIRKIGWGAFSGCGNLKYMVGDDEYIYKSYDKTKTDATYKVININNRTANNQMVLDLRECTKLHSIAKDAFKDCGNIRVIHLPDNKAAGATESNIYIGKDPEATGYDGAIVSNNSIRIMIEETWDFANNNSSGHNAGVHYPSTSFGNNPVFYQLKTKNDIPSTDTSKYKYWVKRDGFYLLFDGSQPAVDARYYFDHLS